MGVKRREKTGHGCLCCNFSVFRKRGSWDFFSSCFANFGWRKRAENLALVDVGWRQGLFYLPVYTGDAPRQNSEAGAALPAA